MLHPSTRPVTSLSCPLAGACTAFQQRRRVQHDVQAVWTEGIARAGKPVGHDDHVCAHHRQGRPLAAPPSPRGAVRRAHHRPGWCIPSGQVESRLGPHRASTRVRPCLGPGWSTVARNMHARVPEPPRKQKIGQDVAHGGGALSSGWRGFSCSRRSWRSSLCSSELSARNACGVDGSPVARFDHRETEPPVLPTTAALTS